MEPFVNKIAESGLITLDLETFMPEDEAVMEFDIKPFLFKELMLREKDFRTAMAEFDFTIFQDKYVGVHCSADAIMPMWAYMLVMTYLEGKAQQVFFGDKKSTIHQIAIHNIKHLDMATYIDARVIIKGCGDRSVSEGMYLNATQVLLPVVKTLMFGEACSTVPIFKKKKLLK